MYVGTMVSINHVNHTTSRLFFQSFKGFHHSKTIAWTSVLLVWNVSLRMRQRFLLYVCTFYMYIYWGDSFFLTSFTKSKCCVYICGFRSSSRQKKTKKNSKVSQCIPAFNNCRNKEIICKDRGISTCCSVLNECEYLLISSVQSALQIFVRSVWMHWYRLRVCNSSRGFGTGPKLDKGRGIVLCQSHSFLFPQLKGLAER